MDVSVLDLWLPILLSAVAVFIASFMMWMVLPHHNKDIKKLPNEDEFRERFRAMNPGPGQYMWPNCADKEEMKSEEFKQRFAEGPWGVMIVPNGKPNFGRNLALMFVFLVVAGVFVAYLTAEARVAGASFVEVFQVATTVGVAAHVLGSFPHAVFFSRPVRAIVTDTADGLVYAVITGLVFAALWPAGATPVG